MPAPKGNKYAVGAKSGAKKKIKDAATMWGHFEAYAEFTKSRPFLVNDFVGKFAEEVDRKKERALTYEGFCNYLEDKNIIGNPEHYFINYQGRYEEFIYICSRIKRTIRQDQIEGGLAGIYNPSITQRLNGLVEKVEVKEEEKVIDLSNLPDDVLQQIIDAAKANGGNAGS